MKSDSQEASLGNIINDPASYGGKATWFQNTNNNRRGTQSRPIKSPSLFRGGGYSLLSVMLRGAEESILGDGKEASFQ